MLTMMCYAMFYAMYFRYCNGGELFDYIDENGPLDNERYHDNGDIDDDHDNGDVDDAGLL